MDTRRHAPIGRRRVQVTANAQRRVVPGYRRRSTRLHDLYTADHLDIRQAGRFRWLFSTCLAAAVGMLAILVVLVGSMDQREAEGGLFSALARMGDAPLASLRLPSVRVDGLRWAIPKTDRLLIASGASVTKSVILDHIRQRRGTRDYMLNKPYARLAARLAPLSKADAQRVPPFNPFKLYANPDPLEAGERREDGQQDASTKLVELLGGILPTEDGQELSSQEVLELVARHLAADAEVAGLVPGSESGRVAGELLAGRSRRCGRPTRRRWRKPCLRPRTPATTWRAARCASCARKRAIRCRASCCGSARSPGRHARSRMRPRRFLPIPPCSPDRRFMSPWCHR